MTRTCRSREEEEVLEGVFRKKNDVPNETERQKKETEPSYEANYQPARLLAVIME